MGSLSSRHESVSGNKYVISLSRRIELASIVPSWYLRMLTLRLALWILFFTLLGSLSVYLGLRSSSSESGPLRSALVWKAVRC